MRSKVIGFMLVLLLATACNGGGNATSTPAPASGYPAPSAPTEAAYPAGLPPTQVPTLAPAISEDFVPSAPEAVNLAAGKPQLVEFYAVW